MRGAEGHRQSPPSVITATRHCYENSPWKDSSLSLRERVRARAFPHCQPMRGPKGHRQFPLPVTTAKLVPDLIREQESSSANGIRLSVWNIIVPRSAIPPTAGSRSKCLSVLPLPRGGGPGWGWLPALQQNSEPFRKGRHPDPLPQGEGTIERPGPRSQGVPRNPVAKHESSPGGMKSWKESE